MTKLKLRTKAYVETSTNRWNNSGTGVFIRSQIKIMGVCKITYSEFNIVIFYSDFTGPIYGLISRNYTRNGITAMLSVIGSGIRLA